MSGDELDFKESFYVPLGVLVRPKFGQQCHPYPSKLDVRREYVDL